MPVLKLEPDLEETFNRHDFWRGCYATMLAELKLEHIKEFFDSVPMVIGGRRIEGAELFNLFWNEKGSFRPRFSGISYMPLRWKGKGTSSTGNSSATSKSAWE